MRTPGNQICFTDKGAEFVAPTPEHALQNTRQRLASASKGRVVGGPLLPDVDPANVWYDGVVAPIDIDTLVGNVSAARRRVVEACRFDGPVTAGEANAANTHHGLTTDGVWTDTPDATFTLLAASSALAKTLVSPTFGVASAMSNNSIVASLQASRPDTSSKSPRRSAKTTRSRRSALASIARASCHRRGHSKTR